MASENEIDLRRALESNEIVPYFQPIVELRSGLLTGFEVLARWQHPKRGTVLPDDFIPLAEKLGLNGMLTGHLLRAVFAAANDIPTHLTLSVNISLTQLSDRSLPKHIRLAAEQARFPLDRLILEITESALVGDTEHAYLIANELKEQGSRLSLDDFGTGYSSLRHLQALPFDELKVDASFVRSMTHTRESRKIAAAVVGLGNSLGLLTVAEGVENQTHAEMLLWLGCDLGQGWLYGRPVPAQELPALLAARSPLPTPRPRLSSFDAGMSMRLEALPTQRLAQLQAIYDGVPVGLCFLDRNLRFVSVNKRLAQIDNIPVASHLGRTVAEVLPDWSSKLKPYLDRALAGEAVSGLESSDSPSHDPHQFRNYFLSYQPARDEMDEVVGVSVSVVDITERQRAEKALVESEDHYRHAVELNPQVPWTSEPNGMILDVSHRWEKLTGLTKQESLGEGWLKVLHPDDVELTIAAWHQSLRTGYPVDVEYRIRRFDGVWRWMRARAAPRRDERGEIIRWYGTLEDIDDHKTAAEALRHSEALLQAVFNAVPVGLIIADAPDGRVVMSNPRADGILRRPVIPFLNIQEYRSSGAIDAEGRKLDSHEYPLARAIMHGETTESAEVLYQHPDGSRSWVAISAAPIRTQNDKVVGGVVAIQDIDEAKREKQKMLDLASELKKELETHA
jgi:PAS domain S-box-containing protein